MSVIRHRLAKLAEQVKAAGLAGKSMTAELEKVASANDLTVDEIARIAEMANRDVQLGLYKTAQDKRFKFDLADPEQVKAAARKVASTPVAPSTSTFDKLASAIEDAGGDPFAAPYRPADKLSVLQHQLSDERFAKLAAEQQDVDDRNMLFELDKSRLEIEVLVREGMQQEAKIAKAAVDNHKAMIQGAMDMVATGVTLPDLYAAVHAAVSGSTVDKAEKKAADEIMMLILTGLKERGMRNYQLGFRDQGDPAELDKMSNEQLVEMCKRVCGYSDDAFSMRDVKTADVNYVEGTYQPSALGKRDEPTKLLDARESIGDVPSMYLDDAVNQVGDKTRVVDGSNAFVVAVRELAGDQRRMVQVHGALEYLGLKLKQIEEAMRGLMAVRSAEEPKEVV